MRRFAGLLICAIVLLGCGALAFAQSQTVSGKLVDLACSKMNNQMTSTLTHLYLFAR